ncbi:SusE domain-containing protein [Flavivirga algicola]|uniref:SusF/SusE family outer membrane protein n=1 Tax=Flavivirga algicola TaxID=2729136 RepID=A0ABX1RWS8_9FLAO|nr:SusE domain-containing protein [Flavivirga algicola]NMH86785.1 SusF/SusE family outer membrane protein [Flavivirga algicola]
MKNIKKISIFIFTVCAFILSSSCDDDTEKFIASETAPVVLSDLTIATIELDPVNINNPAMTLSWNEADYGQQASVNYSIEIASDEAFTESTVATSITGNNTVTLSVSELNAAAGSVGLPPFAWNMLYARVSSSIGSQNGLSVKSNSISFSVFPYFNYKFNDFYLVGNGTAPGWNNNDNNPPLFRDPVNSNLYHYTGYFTKGSGGDGEGRFKVLETRGLWQPQWGVTDNEGDDDIKTSGEIAGNPGTQSGDPGRFGVPSDGFYSFTIDFSKNTYTNEPFDASGATDFTSMEIQGSATATTAMTQSSFDSHLWNITSVRLVPGDLQFVTNTGSTWSGATEFSGQATENTGSIPVIVEDDYEVWFSDLDGRYILIPLNL